MKVFLKVFSSATITYKVHFPLNQRHSLEKTLSKNTAEYM